MELAHARCSMSQFGQRHWKVHYRCNVRTRACMGATDMDPKNLWRSQGGCPYTHITGVQGVPGMQKGEYTGEGCKQAREASDRGWRMHMGNIVFAWDAVRCRY